MAYDAHCTLREFVHLYYYFLHYPVNNSITMIASTDTITDDSCTHIADDYLTNTRAAILLSAHKGGFSAIYTHVHFHCYFIGNGNANDLFDNYYMIFDAWPLTVTERVDTMSLDTSGIIYEYCYWSDYFSPYKLTITIILQSRCLPEARRIRGPTENEVLLNIYCNNATHTPM